MTFISLQRTGLVLLLLLLGSCSRFDSSNTPPPFPENTDADIADVVTVDLETDLSDTLFTETTGEETGDIGFDPIADLEDTSPQPEVITLEGLHINEILFNPINRGVTSEKALPPLQRIEIYNAGPENAQIGGLQLALGSFEPSTLNGIIYTLPDGEMPPDSYLNLYLIPNLAEWDSDEDGFIADDLGLEDDLDYSDGPSGGLYIDPGGILGIDPGGILGIDPGGILGINGDGISLLDNTGNTVAFVAYGEGPLAGEGTLYTQAVEQGKWAEDDRVVTQGMEPGDTFGLILDGFHASSAGLGDQISGIVSPDMAAALDYRTYSWETYQLTGSTEPTNPIQIHPLNSTLTSTETLTLNWYACPGAHSYLLEFSDGEDFGLDGSTLHQVFAESATYSTSLSELAMNYFYWRVSCLYGDTGQVQTPASHHWEAGFIDLSSAASGDSGGIWMPTILQRKDSPMLCLYDAANGNSYGCEESMEPLEEPFVCAWNEPHPNPGIHGVGICGAIGANYAARAAVQMAHRYLTNYHQFVDSGIPNDPDGDGITAEDEDNCPLVDNPEQADANEDGVGDDCDPTISQDYISYLTFHDVDPAGIATADDPEGDLGVGVGMSVDQTRDVLAEVLDVERESITVQESPTFEEITGWIDEKRPVILFRYWASGGGHVTVLHGYNTSPINTLSISDPAYFILGQNSLVVSYADYLHNGLDPEQPATAIVPPLEIGTGPISDPISLWGDLDGDQISDFDEALRLDLEIELSGDSDGDLISDYNEVYSYTFSRHDPETGYNGIATCQDEEGLYIHCADVDLDGIRAEGDPDSDRDGEIDGFEDINGNGGRDESGGEFGGVGATETDVYDRNNWEAAFEFDKIGGSYYFGEPVVVTGGTMHRDSAFEAINQLLYPFNASNTAMLTTDDTGFLAEDELTTQNLLTYCNSGGLGYYEWELSDFSETYKFSSLIADAGWPEGESPVYGGAFSCGCFREDDTFDVLDNNLEPKPNPEESYNVGQYFDINDVSTISGPFYLSETPDSQLTFAVSGTQTLWAESSTTVFHFMLQTQTVIGPDPEALSTQHMQESYHLDEEDSPTHPYSLGAHYWVVGLLTHDDIDVIDLHMTVFEHSGIDHTWIEMDPYLGEDSADSPEGYPFEVTEESFFDEDTAEITIFLSLPWELEREFGFAKVTGFRVEAHIAGGLSYGTRDTHPQIMLFEDDDITPTVEEVSIQFLDPFACDETSILWGINDIAGD
jgi:hypothetical protein